MQCAKCDSDNLARISPSPGVKSSIEEWKCQTCGHSFGCLVDYPPEIIDEDSDNDLPVNAWCVSGCNSDYMAIAKYLGDASINATQIRASTTDGRYSLGQIPMHLAKWHQAMAQEHGVIVKYKKAAQQGD